MKKILNILILFPILFFGQTKKIDSIKIALKNEKQDSSKCLTLLLLFKLETNNKLKMEYGRQRLEIAESHLTGKNKTERTFFLKQKAGALNTIGTIYYQEGDLSKALAYYEMSLKIKEEIGDKIGIASSLNNIGIIYKDRGDISKTLDYYHMSLKIKEEIGDKAGISASLNNIGNIYKSQGDISKALEYWNKSLKMREEIGDKKGTSNSLNNIGTVYQEQGDFQRAMIYHQRSLKIRKEVDDKQGVAMSLNNIGTICFKQGDLLKALDYYQKSLKIYEEISDKDGIASCLLCIGTAYTNLGNVSEGFSYANRSMKIAKELGFPDKINAAASQLKLIFQKQNKYKEALTMYELEIKMRDSTNNNETQKAAVKKEMQYAYEKKELEAKVEQEKKDLLAKEALKQREKERNYFIIGLGLVMLLALFILRGYRQKQKANVLISEQKQLVEEKQKEILDSIRYARRIQSALITPEKYIEKSLSKLQD